MRHSVFKRYSFGLAALVGGGLVFMAAFNALVNPFNLYEGPRIAGFNDFKYELGKYSRVSKAAEVRRLRPDCLVLGSSRAQLGLNPAHPGWADCRRPYNLAHNGGSLYEAMRYWQHAEAVRRPREVVLALDLLMFNVYRARRQPGYAEERLLTQADGRPNPAWRATYLYDIFAGLISRQTFLASWSTVFPSYERRVAGPEDGYWEYTRADAEFLSRRGQRDAFQRNEEAFVTEHWFPPPQHRFATRDPASGVDSYDDLRTMLRLAHRDDTRLIMLISPAHARQREALDQVGLWREWETWKRTLVRINEEEARRAGHAPYPLWDFSGFGRYTTEDVPPPGDHHSVMRWYWESSHYRKELGDRVLDRVFGVQSPGRARPDDFGVRLDSRNIEPQLAAVRAGHGRWRATHAEDVAEIAEIVRRTANWRAP